MIAAGAQNKAFNFAQILYDNQGTENTGWLNDCDGRPGGREHSRHPRAAGAEPAVVEVGREPGE